MNRIAALLRASAAGIVAETAIADPTAFGPADLSAADILQRFDRALERKRAYEHGTRNPVAEDTVAREVESAVAALRKDPDAHLRPSQILGLEAVVRADGSRPSLLISERHADPEHPQAKPWRNKLSTSLPVVERLAGATARVQPRGGSRKNYFGSAFLVGRQPGRMVTNRHVAMQAMRRAAVTRAAAPHPLLTSFDVYRGTIEVDFMGEHGRDATCLRAVRRVLLPPWPHTDDLASMDIAVLELEDDGKALPEPVPVLRSEKFEAAGSLHSVCTVGFPGEPPHRSGIVDGVDWAFVDQAIFNEQYGVKRLAPGEVHRSFTQRDEYGAGYTFGHDATTLGGCSGSAICAWIDGGAAFGLHFHGTSTETNRAHGFSSPDTRLLLAALLALPELAP